MSKFGFSHGWIDSSKGRQYPYYIYVERVRGKHAKTAFHGSIYSEEITEKGNSIDYSLPFYPLTSDYADELTCILQTFTVVTAEDLRIMRDFFEQVCN